jgi:hypothetical protein
MKQYWRRLRQISPLNLLSSSRRAESSFRILVVPSIRGCERVRKKQRKIIFAINTILQPHPLETVKAAYVLNEKHIHKIMEPWKQNPNTSTSQEGESYLHAAANFARFTYWGESWLNPEPVSMLKLRATSILLLGVETWQSRKFLFILSILGSNTKTILWNTLEYRLQAYFCIRSSIKATGIGRILVQVPIRNWIFLKNFLAVSIILELSPLAFLQ